MFAGAAALLVQLSSCQFTEVFGDVDVTFRGVVLTVCVHVVLHYAAVCQWCWHHEGHHCSLNVIVNRVKARVTRSNTERERSVCYRVAILCNEPVWERCVQYDIEEPPLIPIQRVQQPSNTTLGCSHDSLMLCFQTVSESTCKSFLGFCL